MADAILIVALYSEDGMQMLASGRAAVSADERQASLEIQGIMPEFFLASALYAYSKAAEAYIG